MDQDRTFGLGALHDKVGPPAAKERGADSVSLLYGQAVQDAANIGHVALRQPQGAGRGEHDALGWVATGPAHRYELVQPRSGVLTHQSVNLDAGLPAKFLVEIGREHV